MSFFLSLLVLTIRAQRDWRSSTVGDSITASFISFGISGVVGVKSLTAFSIFCDFVFTSFISYFSFIVFIKTFIASVKFFISASNILFILFGFFFKL